MIVDILSVDVVTVLISVILIIISDVLLEKEGEWAKKCRGAMYIRPDLWGTVFCYFEVIIYVYFEYFVDV